MRDNPASGWVLVSEAPQQAAAERQGNTSAPRARISGSIEAGRSGSSKSA